MDLKDVIVQLELLKAEIEWDFSLEYQLALAYAIMLLKKLPEEFEIKEGDLDENESNR